MSRDDYAPRDGRCGKTRFFLALEGALANGLPSAAKTQIEDAVFWSEHF
jgi:hypothetical protein